MASHPVNAKYPDTVALTYDETNHKVACVYSDRSLYLWDITDIRKVIYKKEFQDVLWMMKDVYYFERNENKK